MHWNIFYIIGKLSKCRCQKWACMSHLDICSTSYDKKKSPKSNWQFDSWLLKIGNRPDPSVRKWSVIHHWKAFDEGYNFASDFVMVKGLHMKLCALKIARLLIVKISGLPLGSLGTKPFGCGPRGKLQSLLYGGRSWLPPSSGRGESCESKIARGLS